jgi:single-strand selective monofunctional uracil DNA glycosylase
VTRSKKTHTKVSEALLKATDRLAKKVDALTFSEPTAYVYNPLRYARPAIAEYLRRYARGRRPVFFLGMNPGPFGMAQTGIPFGEIEAVRDWMGIETKIGKPKKEHPKRPILGFQCTRSEVSGRRLWGYFQEKCSTPHQFFSKCYVANYCPLVFLEEGGRNRTPDKLLKSEKEKLHQICDAHLLEVVAILKPKIIVGVGKWAKDRAQTVLGEQDLSIVSVLHPSPASPAANRGWAAQAERELQDAGVLAYLE